MTISNKPKLLFTGERFVPGIEGNIMIEHYHRYLFSTIFISGLDVLDIACGEGYGSDLLGRAAKTVVGVDIDAEAVAHATTTYSSDNVEFRRGSADHIPLESGSVDVVVSFETIEHHDRHEEMLAEIKRVLRPNGLLIMSSPDKEFYSDARGYHNEYHVKELYKQQFIDLLKRSFAHLSLFGQKLTYGSGIFPEGISSGHLNFPQNESCSRPGFLDPLYSLAFASDDLARVVAKPSSFMEFDLYKSEAMSERFQIEASLRLALAQKERDAAALLAALRHKENYVAALRAALSYSGAVASQAYKTLVQQEARQKALQEPQQKALPQAQQEALLVDQISRQAAQIDAMWRFAFVWRAMFHKCGKPRGWMRRLMLADPNTGKPRSVTRRLFFKKNGRVRPMFSAWFPGCAAADGLATPTAPAAEILLASLGAKAEASASAAIALPDYRDRLRSVQQTGLLSKARNVLIVTTAHTIFVGEAIKAALVGTRLRCVTTTVMPETFENDLYIVVCPQMFPQLPSPDKLICFQMEQTRSSPWISEKYLYTLLRSLAVLDYSIDNIEYLQTRGVSLYQTYYVPIQPTLSLRQNATGVRDIDILFYGAINSPRRQKFLEALGKKFYVRIETELFGEPLRELLARAKVVVNIHFYDDALLETTRIAEALSHGARVVSETARDQARHDALRGFVEFAAVNDIDGFVKLVEFTLREYAPLAADAFCELNHSPWGMRSLMARALHGVGVFDYYEFEAATIEVQLNSDRVVLCLPESTHRFANAEGSVDLGAALFPGLRNIDGWKGAALSYKYLSTRALREGKVRFTIWEDDAELPHDFDRRYQTTLAYLQQLGDRWDVFSGLLSDFSEDAKVEDVTHFHGDVFIKTDKVIGMVLGIYNRSSLELLSNFIISGDDTMKYTIDRYMESKTLRCITCIPPLVGHSIEFSSTLWSANGTDFVTNTPASLMINDSQNRLVQKLIEYYDSLENGEVTTNGC